MTNPHDFSSEFKMPVQSPQSAQSKKDNKSVFTKRFIIPAIILSILVGLFGSYNLVTHRGDFYLNSTSLNDSGFDSNSSLNSDENSGTQFSDWAPSGYNIWSDDPNIAWKWNNDASCDTYSCWNIDFISQTGCSYFYASIDILDSNGNIVDNTNATLPSLPSLQASTLRFDNVQELGNQADLSTVTCN